MDEYSSWYAQWDRPHRDANKHSYAIVRKAFFDEFLTEVGTSFLLTMELYDVSKQTN